MFGEDDNLIIVGAGPSGIAMGCQLQRKFGFKNFEIYDKNEDFGGTWYANTYPGCGCDTPSHFYSFSFEKNSQWSRVFPLQPELLAYFKKVSSKYDLPAHTHFKMECLKAEWNVDTEQWMVTFRNVGSGDIRQRSCKFLVFCVGVFSVANPCPLPGVENFKGEIFHSAQWNHKVNLAGKDLIVIGNGCSAIQFIPAIQPKVKSLTHFIRSQQWILPGINWQCSKMFRYILRNIPGASEIFRFLLAGFLDAWFFMFRTQSGKWLRDYTARETEKYLKAKTPEKYHPLLIPNFTMGAKRRIFNSGYLECLSSSKVLLTDDPLIQIKERSVLTKSGKEYPADVIVYATGFQVREFLASIEVRGKSGEDLQSRWKRQGGPRAYKGVMVADFPNLFTVIGPNTISGHYSVIYMSECNVNFILKLLKPLLFHRKYRSLIEVTEEGEKKDVEWAQSRMKQCIWNEGEGGYYTIKETGHNPVVYPHYQTNYWFRTLIPNWSDFVMIKKNKRGLLESSNWRRDNLIRIFVILVVISISMFILVFCIKSKIK